MIVSALSLYSFFGFFLAVWLLMVDRRIEILALSFFILLQSLIPYIYQAYHYLQWSRAEILLAASFVFHALAILRSLIIFARKQGISSTDDLQLLRG